MDAKVLHHYRRFALLQGGDFGIRRIVILVENTALVLLKLLLLPMGLKMILFLLVFLLCFVFYYCFEDLSDIHEGISDNPDCFLMCFLVCSSF